MPLAPSLLFLPSRLAVRVDCCGEGDTMADNLLQKTAKTAKSS
jgi:hypothetical protein